MKRRVSLAVHLLVMVPALIVTLTCCSSDEGPLPVSEPAPLEPEISHEYGSCEPNNAPFPERPPPRYEATLPFLKVREMQILDENDNPVALRGINFGSWLMMENWIPGIGRETVDEFRSRFVAKVVELGLKPLIDEATARTIVHYLVRDVPIWSIYKSWIDYAIDHAASPQQRQKAEQLWEWFDNEPWIYEERNLWRYFVKRFGWAKMELLRNTFQDNFITELDVQRASEMGFTLIRVPVWYEALETDYKNEENFFKPEGWRRLDNLLDWARKHRIYIMIDLHGAPGGQNGYWHMGLAEGGDLWERPKCIAKTARLWGAIANYFRDEPHVAVYDLLNEPNTVPSKKKFIAVYDAIYREIRKYDTRHIIGLTDGFVGPERIATPKEMGWESDCCIMQGHYYPGYAGVPTESAEDYRDSIENDLVDYARRFRLLYRFKMPLFAGEFNAAVGGEGQPWAAEGMDLVLDMMNRRGVHWAPWTWKYYRPGSTWGVYHPREPLHPEITCTDSPIYQAVIGPTAIIGQDDCYQIDVTAEFEEILADFKKLNSVNYVPSLPAYYQALVHNAKAPFATTPNLWP